MKIYFHLLWKCNFPMNPHVRLLAGRSVGGLVGLLVSLTEFDKI